MRNPCTAMKSSLCSMQLEKAHTQKWRPMQTNTKRLNGGGGIGMGNTCKPMAVSFQCMTKFTTKKKKRLNGLSWWFSGKESACQCRRHGFDPWSGNIPRAMEQLRPCATTMELWIPGAANPRDCALQQEKPQQWEACAPQLEGSPHSPQLEKGPCSHEDPAQLKGKQIEK